MTDSVSAIRFENKDGNMLFGILEKPDKAIDRSIGVLLLSPGIKMRVAPHQLYNKMSKKLTSLGFTVFRFDFYGLGDSEGIVDEKLLADLYGSIQIGRYVDDTKCAIDWLSSQCYLEKFILAGLCGGAVTGLLEARTDDRVIGLLGLGIPVILDGSNVDSSKYLTTGQMDRLHQGYINRLFSIKSWLRLLSFQSDFKVIFKILKSKLYKQNESKTEKVKNAPVDNTNPFFAEAMFDCMDRQCKVLYIFSGSDRLAWEYEEKFEKIYQERLNGYGNIYKSVTIDEANHILTMPKWQNEMLDLSEQWLNLHFNTIPSVNNDEVA
ncbi:MAG: hypothetical protein OQK98_05990 [Gammaproteobacteria bacterium]|nr:hypothetical protein [Gammaproteobacteria bacterium]